MNTARSDVAGVGIYTAALVAFGNPTPPGNTSVKTESYNGSNWTEVNDATPQEDLFQEQGLKLQQWLWVEEMLVAIV